MKTTLTCGSQDCVYFCGNEDLLRFGLSVSENYIGDCKFKSVIIHDGKCDSYERVNS